MAIEGQTHLYDYVVFPMLALVPMLWVFILDVLMWRRVRVGTTSERMLTMQREILPRGT
jgi:hypothetical protein